MGGKPVCTSEQDDEAAQGSRTIITMPDRCSCDVTRLRRAELIQEDCRVFVPQRQYPTLPALPADAL